ncbi:MAG: hypothetical protein M3547_13245, partial [Acidobacteriota bacterium]|nr:hypothetical protein [Acidobacteriota bacterium]
PLPPIDLWPPSAPRRETDPFDITSVPYAPAPASEPGSTVPEPAEHMLSRDVSLDGIPSRDVSQGDEEVSASKLRLPEPNWPFEPAPETPLTPALSPQAGRGRHVPAGPSADAVESPVEPGASGRTLAELYFEQGHDKEAIRLADELLVAIPGDEGLERLRGEAAKRLAAAPAAQVAAVPPPVEDPGRERRLAKIRLLNQWLAAVGERSRP